MMEDTRISTAAGLDLSVLHAAQWLLACMQHSRCSSKFSMPWLQCVHLSQNTKLISALRQSSSAILCGQTRRRCLDQTNQIYCTRCFFLFAHVPWKRPFLVFVHEKAFSFSSCMSRLFMYKNKAACPCARTQSVCAPACLCYISAVEPCC